VNKEEAERILEVPQTDISKLLPLLLALGSKRVIITDNRNGAYTFDGAVSHVVPMYPDTREPFERTGAGDAFASTITAAIAMGKPFEEALLWGPINSMSVVQKIGAQEGLLSRTAIETFIADAPSEYKLG
jgi:ribokinase